MTGHVPYPYPPPDGPPAARRPRARRAPPAGGPGRAARAAPPAAGPGRLRLGRRRRRRRAALAPRGAGVRARLVGRAMASGCPCLVADTGGLREVVPHEEVGLRFRARDPESLASVAVRVLADDELGRRLVAEAYEHVRSFDWADVAEQTAGIYAELAATARPGRASAG